MNQNNSVSTSAQTKQKKATVPPCSNCGAGGMGHAFFDSGWVSSDPNRPGFDVDGRCETCGML